MDVGGMYGRQSFHPVANLNRERAAQTAGDPWPTRSWLRVSVKYYFIDFGISRKYDPADLPPREPPIFGGDRSVPEFNKSDEPCDPFPTDIYYVGNLIREDFLQVRSG